MSNLEKVLKVAEEHHADVTMNRARGTVCITVSKDSDSNHVFTAIMNACYEHGIKYFIDGDDEFDLIYLKG